MSLDYKPDSSFFSKGISHVVNEANDSIDLYENQERLSYLFNSLPGSENPGIVISQIEKIVNRKEIPLDVVLFESKGIENLIECLKSSSTVVCRASLHCIYIIMLKSTFPHKVLLSNLHSFVRIMRGPSLMPFVCMILIEVVEHLPQASNTLLKNEHIIALVLSLLDHQVSKTMTGFLLLLLSRVWKKAKKSMVYIRETQYGVTFERRLISFLHNYVLYCSLDDIWVLYPSLCLFESCIKHWNDDCSIIIPNSVIYKLIELTDKTSSAGSNSLLPVIIEVWNIIVIKYFNELVLLDVIDVIIQILLRHCEIDKAPISRILFFFCNVSATNEGSRIIISHDIFGSAYEMYSSFSMSSKENLLFLFMNLLLNCFETMTNSTSFSSIFADCIDFVTCSISPDYSLVFLKSIEMINQQNSKILTDMDYYCIENALNDLIGSSETRVSSKAIIIKKLIEETNNVY